ncbi:MAG: Bifunctional ligase/repressor BirA [Syntrophomonadaceae bacterium]|nr:Bifunctional ligase/repressor BirA [Bacillota bacterium]MBT9147957.1 Bifunctional ligase/repressor BirA [Bacillota bacterium]
MPYERAHQIEQRFERAIHIIKQNSHNSRELAAALGVSRPTVQRIVAELKQRGHVIRSVGDEHGWRYELVSSPPSANRGIDTLVTNETIYELECLEYLTT